jgi:hypothetical protein
MKTNADHWGEPVLAPVARQSLLDVDAALDSIDGPLERDEEAVTRVVDRLAAVVRKGGSQLPVMPLQELSLCLIADQPDEVRRGDDVREHEGLGQPLLRVLTVSRVAPRRQGPALISRRPRFRARRPARPKARFPRWENDQTNLPECVTDSRAVGVGHRQAPRSG